VTSGKTRKVIPYEEARTLIRDADLFLFRGRGLVSLLIQRGGRGHYSHAGMAVWARDTLLCCEIREWHGGRAVTLSSQVRAFPSRIDWYESAPHGMWPEFDRAATADCMLRKAGTRYGYAAVLNAGLLHLPFVRLLIDPETDDTAGDSAPEYCSAGVANCYRLGKIDPVFNLSDRLTEPNDLSRSPFFQYRATLEMTEFSN